MTEIWKDITGYEGLYQVSNLGRIKSLERVIDKKMGSKGIKYEKIMSPGITDGYCRIKLRSNGSEERFKVHRLVAIHFIPNGENKPDVNHIDGNKGNNIASNLEWVTKSENTTHAYKIGLKVSMKGAANPRAKLTDQKVIEIKDTHRNGLASYSQLAIEYKVDKALIARIITGKCWKHIIVKKSA